MIMRIAILACFFVICTIIGSCVSLECYTCFGDDNCADPFNTTNAMATECPSINGSTPACSASEDKTSGTFIRSCTSADECSTGCLSDVDLGLDLCTYCCDGDRCNSGSVADAVADVLYCYTCFWSSDSPDNNTCNDPFDPNGTDVFVVPCDGECGISKADIPFGGGSVITRGCFSPSSVPCEPGCNGPVCMTCCSENLCNGGPATPPTTPSPNGAPSLYSKGKSATATLAAILLVCTASVI